jgi:hypothetical protein
MSADSPAQSTPPPVVQVRDMDFCYGTSKALFDINLKVEYHRVTALIGLRQEHAAALHQPHERPRSQRPCDEG